MRARCPPAAQRALAAIAMLAAVTGCRTPGEPQAAATVATAGLDTTRTARCADGDRTWTARLIDDRERGSVTIVDVTSPRGIGADEPWSLVTAAPTTHDRVQRAVPATDLDGTALMNVDEPRLVTPDGRCTLYLVPPGTPGRLPVVVVGDSLAAALVATDDQRLVLGGSAGERGLRVVVDGQSGAPWTPLPDSGAVLDDELRGARSYADGVAVATVIGANDAIIAALTPEPEKAAQRRRTDEAIAAFVAGARRDGRCVVLTTPPDAPIDNFDLRRSYADEARRVGDVLRDHGDRDPGVVVVDFAEVSRAHHRPDGTPGDWFSGGDELHPNEEGSAALAALLLDAAASCRGLS